jgi:hypothetical protein
MSEKFIKVWNSTQGVIKFGASKTLIYPGETRVFTVEEGADHPFIDDKLVIIPQVSEETEPPKRKKKETTEVPVEEIAVEEIPVEEQIEPIAEVESTEDSILPE